MQGRTRFATTLLAAATLVLTGIAPASTLAAGTDPQQHEHLDSARRSLDRAGQQLRESQERLSDATSDLQRSVDAQAQSVQRLQQIQRDAIPLARQLGVLQGNLLAQGELYLRARQPLDAIDREIAAATQRIEQADRQMKAAAQAAENQYVQSPTYAAYDIGIQETQTAIAEHRKRIVEAAEQDPTYQALRHKADQAEAAIKTARDDPTVRAPTLARLSQEWIHAKNRFQSAQRIALQADTDQTDSETVLAILERQKVAALKKFRDTVGADPLVKPAADALALARQDRDQIATRRIPVARAFAPHARRYQEADSAYSAAVKALDAVRHKYDAVITGGSSAGETMRSAQENVDRASRELRDAQERVERARCLLRDLEQRR